MQLTNHKLAELQQELKVVIKEVKEGKLDAKEAADKILHLREEMDKVIERLRSISK